MSHPAQRSPYRLLASRGVGTVLLLLLAASASPSSAITWDFEEHGGPQGWRARSSASSTGINLPPLRSEVSDGIWRVQLLDYDTGLLPAVELISPFLGHSCGLFDSVRVRFRIVHQRPVAGWFGVGWTNPFSLLRDRADPLSHFRHVPSVIATPLVLTTEWQEAVFTDFPDRPVHINSELYDMWDGELSDIRLHFILYESAAIGAAVSGPEDIPELLEIDRIVLTGVGEQLAGELPPPTVSPEDAFGELLSSATFVPIRRNLGGVFGAVSAGVLGDTDGDGDADLVALWSDKRSKGWMSAVNDGTGMFELEHERAHGGYFVQVFGADLDADGRLDLMVGTGINALFMRREDDGWTVKQELSSVWPVGLADVDADGDVDACLARGGLLLLLNDGAGRFDQETLIVLDPSREGFYPLSIVSPGAAGKAVGIIWRPPFSDLGLGYEISWIAAGGRVAQDHLAMDVHPSLVRHAGDLDGDGDVDVIVSREIVESRALGLSLLLNRGDGAMDEQVIDAGATLIDGSVLVRDVNGDGRVDVLYVDTDTRASRLVVLAGAADGGPPLMEGRYPLEGDGGRVLSGDVDGDGDTDIVVLEADLYGEGGVYVFKNRMSERTTAITDMLTVAAPAAPSLVAYPNPANPESVIRYTVADDGAGVELVVLDQLGRHVRTLVHGTQLAGTCRAAWNGKDDAGHAVASGIYLVRLRAGTQQAVCKVTLVR